MKCIIVLIFLIPAMSFAQTSYRPKGMDIVMTNINFSIGDTSIIERNPLRIILSEKDILNRKDYTIFSGTRAVILGDSIFIEGGKTSTVYLKQMVVSIHSNSQVSFERTKLFINDTLIHSSVIVEGDSMVFMLGKPMPITGHSYFSIKSLVIGSWSFYLQLESFLATAEWNTLPVIPVEGLPLKFSKINLQKKQ